MFETAELGRKIGKKEYAERVEVLREELLDAQARLRSADFPVIVLFAGVDGAGKGDSTNLLSSWLDPRGLMTRAFGESSEEEEERPEYWRFWRALPPKGQIGLFLSAWYTRPFLDRVHDRSSEQEYDLELDRIATLERTLAFDGALILKFWMHLGRDAQKKRFEFLESQPLQRWRVKKKDWRHWRMYDRFISAAEQTIMRTSTGLAPWKIIEGADQRFRSLEVGQALLQAIQRRLDGIVTGGPREEQITATAESLPADGESRPMTASVLSSLDLTKTMPKEKYRNQLNKYQGQLNRLHRKARKKGISTILVFEGWDAAGKGGAIRRIIPGIDARDFEVIQIGPPTDEERSQHYLWRFWRHLSRAGRVTVFDRSWYGRVLVERLEGFASHREWSRAYGEINEFERQLVHHGIVLLKFWIHISPDEQAQRFEARKQVSYKRWKLTEEDLRNRDRWDEYELAVHDMVERTSTEMAPWLLVEGNDKRYARVKILKAVCAGLERSLGE